MRSFPWNSAISGQNGRFPALDRHIKAQDWHVILGMIWSDGLISGPFEPMEYYVELTNLICPEDWVEYDDGNLTMTHAVVSDGVLILNGEDDG